MGDIKTVAYYVVIAFFISIFIVWSLFYVGAIQTDQCRFGGYDGYSTTLNCCYEDEYDPDGEWRGYVCVGYEWNDTDALKKEAPKPDYFEGWQAEIKYIDCDHSVVCYGKKLSAQLSCTYVPNIQECDGGRMS